MKYVACQVVSRALRSGGLFWRELAAHTASSELLCVCVVVVVVGEEEILHAGSRREYIIKIFREDNRGVLNGCLA